MPVTETDTTYLTSNLSIYEGLRAYQKHAVREIYDGIRRGHRCQILQLPTGSGKTHVAAAIAQHAVERGKRVAFFVDKLVLLEQAVARFEKEGFHVGVIQSAHPKWDARALMLVCSIQTVARRRWQPVLDLGIIDEAHILHARHIRFLREYDALPFIGLTATPCTAGLGKHFSRLVCGATTSQLIDEGYLVAPKVYAPTEPDLRKVETRAGDYVKGQLGKAMNQAKLVGDLVDHWHRLGENRQTLVFAASVAHSKAIQDAFSATGVRCEHLDAYTHWSDRERILGEFERGDVRLLTSVGVLHTGFDSPVASCLIVARPTKSLALHVQMIGRGLRTNDGKDNCLILDHSGNHQRLGFVTDPLPDVLDDGKRSKGKRPRKEALPKPCPSCAFVKPPKVHACPACGFAPEVQDNTMVVDGQLVELVPAKKLPSREELQRFYSEVEDERPPHYKPGWTDQVYRERFGVWPRGMVRTPRKASEDTLKFLKYLRIRNAKRRQKAQKLTCQRCKSANVKRSAGKGPHAARADCGDCGHWWWVAKS